MRDLNATMFYKAKFQICLDDSQACDLLWKVILNIRHWITKKLNRNGSVIVDNRLFKWTEFKMGSKLYDCQEKNAFFAESAYHKASDTTEKISWSCMIIEKPTPEVGFAQRTWTTEIGYQSTTPNAAEISYVVTYSDATGYIGPCADIPTSSVPNVIKNLMSDPSLRCRIGQHQLSLSPQKLSPGDYPKFEQLIFDPHREVPLIYISPQKVIPDTISPITFSISPEKVAASVAANALVFYSDQPDFSREMRFLGNDAYGCFDGAVRVYAPHADSENKADPYRHRFFLAKEIEEKGEDYVLNIFRRALAQDVHFYVSMFRLNDCKALLEADKHQSRISEIRNKSEHDVDEAMRELLIESDKRQEAELLALEYQDQLEDKKRDIHSLSIQLEAFREKAQRCDIAETSNKNIRSIQEFPNTPTKIAQYFQTLYPERITFTERAFRSLEECSTKCELLWEIFYLMATELYDLLKFSPAQAYKEFTNKTGWACARGEGMMTRKDADLMRQYIDHYRGHEIDIQPHIKSHTKESDPRFVRIHFSYTPAVADQIIISHCGKHLDNYSTRKVK